MTEKLDFKLYLEVNDKVKDGEFPIASCDIIQDILDGYLKPEELLRDSEDIRKVKEAIQVIEEFVQVLDKYIEEM